MSSLRRACLARGGRWRNPFIASGPYPSGFRGDRLLTQLHCHTTSSDGSYAPATVVAGYLAAGYDVLAITDHDMVTSQPAGITTAIPGNELSPTGQHIISINSSYTRGATTDAQTIIDGIIAAGGQAEIAHPNWDTGMTYAEMAALTDYLGIEIHNGVATEVAADPTANPGWAIDRWDELLTNVRRDVWGLSVDDLHVMTNFMTYDTGRLQVWAASPNVSDVMAALVRGNFAADVSNYGVEAAYPARSNAAVALTCPGASRIEAWGEGGLLDTSTGPSMEYVYDESTSYVRLVAVGAYNEPFDSLSDRWSVIDGTWTASGGVLALDAGLDLRRIILRRQREGAFAAQVDVKLGSVGTDNGALLFNVLDSDHYYMVRIGESTTPSYDNQLTVAKTTNNFFADASELDAYAFDPSPDVWYTMKVDVTTAGRIQAKVWQRGTSEPGWQIDVTDATWTYGSFGLRANRTVAFDNLYINGFRTYYQPISID